MMSIRTIASSGVCSISSIASLPVVAVNVHAAAFQHARQREDVARVVVDEENRAADQIFVRLLSRSSMRCFSARKVGDDAMQKQGRLIEQPLRRFNPLDYDATRHRV